MSIAIYEATLQYFHYNLYERASKIYIDNGRSCGVIGGVNVLIVFFSLAMSLIETPCAIDRLLFLSHFVLLYNINQQYRNFIRQINIAQVGCQKPLFICAAA